MRIWEIFVCCFIATHLHGNCMKLEMFAISTNHALVSSDTTKSASDIRSLIDCAAMCSLNTCCQGSYDVVKEECTMDADCSANMDFSFSAVTLQKIQVPPLVTIAESTYTVAYGSTVTIPCTVVSTNQEYVYWKRVFSPVNTTVLHYGTGTKYLGGLTWLPDLTIKNLHYDDGGEYVCIAVNDGGKASDTTILSVIDPLPKVTIPQLSYAVLMGESVTLECIVSSPSDVAAIDWKHRNTTGHLRYISPSLNFDKYYGGVYNNPSLDIYNAENGDAGNYTCVAYNEAGMGQSNETTLFVFL